MTPTRHSILVGAMSVALGLGYAVGAGLTPAHAATGCASALPGDVNGDGQADAAIGEPGDADFAGAVHVFYGTQDGLVADPAGTALNDQLFTQATTGVPGAGEADDSFGGATTLADLNGDKCADLAIGVPGENDQTGSIVVLYGSPTGITTTGAQAFSENGLFGAGAGHASEQFGNVLTAADLDDDGVADLVAGAPGEQVRAKGSNQGGLAVIYGASGGLNTGRAATFINQDSAGVIGVPNNGDRFAEAVAGGDFDGDGVADLAVGVPGEKAAGGVVQVLHGQAGAPLGGTGSQTLSQDTAGVPGASEDDDLFGGSLAAGDVNGDARDDLAASAIGENNYRGAVNLMLGSASGLTGTGSQIWSQDSSGVVGVARPGDQFGYALAMGHLDNGPLADLAIGVPTDDIGATTDAGGVNVLLGAAGGLTADGAGERFSQDTEGIAGTAETDDGFGFSLAASAVQTPDEDSLIIGAPFETLGSKDSAGMVHQLATFEFGPSPVGSVSLNLDVTGVKGTSEDGSVFGLALD